MVIQDNTIPRLSLRTVAVFVLPYAIKRKWHKEPPMKADSLCSLA